MVEIELAAEQVKQLPLGTRVRLMTRDRFGYPAWYDCELVLTTGGKAKRLKITSPYLPTEFRSITKDMKFKMDRIAYERLATEKH